MSRTDARSTSLRRRPARTVPATIAAVVLLALGVGLVWAAVQRLAQGSWPTFADQYRSLGRGPGLGLRLGRCSSRSPWPSSA